MQYDTDALILAFSWLQIIKVRSDLLLDWWRMLILVQQTLIYRISNHVLGTAMIIQCTYQMKIGKIATFFLYFVTKTWKIQFVLSFLSSIALGGTGTVFQDYFQFILCSYFSEIFSNFGFLGLASTLGSSGAWEISPAACFGRSIESDAVSKAREGFKRSPRHGDGGTLKSRLSSVGREILLILASQYQQNLDGSTLVIYNIPRNTIVIKAKLRFFFWHRSLSEAKTRRGWNTTRLFIISTTDRHRPFYYKQLNEYVKQETESCCETHNILNETGTLVCGNCGQIEGYKTVNEYLNFYENLHKIKKKSVYHRKCHIETHTLMFVVRILLIYHQ